MPRTSNGRRESERMRRQARAKALRLPSWWNALAPGRGPRFWHTVEAMRKEAGATRSDHSAISYIINQLRSHHERNR